MKKDTGARHSIYAIAHFLLSVSMMVTSAVDISIGTGKKSVERSTLNISLPSSAVSSSMRVISMHSCVCPGNKIKGNCPPTKSSPDDKNVSYLYVVSPCTLPSVLLVAVVVMVKSKGIFRGMLSTTHTSTDPSFSSATYVPEDSESVGTVIRKIVSIEN